MATTVRSYSKINLGLRIGPPRQDGFHDLTTMYQTIGLFDRLTVTARKAPATRITMDCTDPRVPTDGRNTVHRMVDAALTEMDATAEVHVALEKNLPVQGGLGAGSANAAAALLGLERELNTALPGPRRMALAERIGSDVPLFLVGGTVYGHNRGEVVLPYPDLPEMHAVIFAPTVGSSTPLAFRAWDARVAQLTPEAATGRLTELSRVYASVLSNMDGAYVQTGASGAFRALDRADSSSRSESLAGNPLPALVRTGIANDFAEVVFQQHPFLRDILHSLWGNEALPEESRAICAALSGSGSSLFGLYRTAADADAAQARTAGFAGRSFRAVTLSREAYWGSIFA